MQHSGFERTRRSLESSHALTDHAFRRFFFPALISNLGLALGGIVDCLVIGAKLGSDGLSAISLGIPVYLFYNVLSYGFSIGGSIHYAYALSAGHPEKAQSIFNNVLRFLILTYLVTVGLSLAFLPQLLQFLGASREYPEVYAIAERYIRTQLIFVPIMFCQGPFFYFVQCDSPNRVAAALTASNVIDIILNYVFVIRLGAGAEGSVWSTAIGAAVCLIICGEHIVHKRGTVRFAWVKLSVKELAVSFRTGVASSVQYIFQFVTVIVANQLLMRTMGVIGVAVFDVLYNLSLFTACISDGMCLTIQPMVSTYRAERNTEAVSRTMYDAVFTGSVIAVGEMIFLVFGAGFLCNVFGLSGKGAEIGIPAISIYAVSVLPAYINQLMVYYDQAAERVRSSFLIESCRLFLFFLPVSLALSAFRPESFWAVFPIAEILTLLVVCFGLRDRWVKDWTARDDRRYTSSVTTDSDLGKEVEAFQEICDEWECMPQQSYFGTLVLEELCAAILEDARKNSRNDITVDFTVLRVGDGLEIHLRDNSIRFNPFELEESDEDDLNVLGMDIVRKKAKEFYYRRFAGFNTLVVRM